MRKILVHIYHLYLKSIKIYSAMIEIIITLMGVCHPCPSKVTSVKVINMYKMENKIPWNWEKNLNLGFTYKTLDQSTYTFASESLFIRQIAFVFCKVKLHFIMKIISSDFFLCIFVTKKERNQFSLQKKIYHLYYIYDDLIGQMVNQLGI